MLPMQLASRIGRTISLITTGPIVCAGIVKVSPFTVVKCTCVPMPRAWVAAVTLNDLLFM